jgi:hypothetical protein
MTHPYNLDRAGAEALGYPTTTAAEFELAEFIRYVVGDENHLHRIQHPPGPPMSLAADAAHVGTGEGAVSP